MYKLLKFWLTEFVYNGHLQSIGAAGLVFVASILLFNTPAPFTLFLGVYLLFESIFIFDRYHDLAIDSLTNLVRTKHISQYKGKIPLILLILVSLMLLLFWQSGTYMIFSSLGILVLGFLYPVYFKRLTRFIPFFKNFYVSLVYALITLLPGLFLHKMPIASLLSIHIPIVVFTEAFIGQILLDMKDIKSDKKVKLKTYPILFGKKKTIETAIFLSFILACVSFFVSKITDAPAVFMFITVTIFIIDSFTILLASRGEKKAYFLAAGKLFFWLIAFAIYELV